MCPALLVDGLWAQDAGLGRRLAQAGYAMQCAFGALCEREKKVWGARTLLACACAFDQRG
jgi:hypothetical protein